VFRRRPDEFQLARARLQDDIRTPLKRWAYGVYGIVTRDYDYAHTPTWTRQVNTENWQLESQSALEARVAALLSGQPSGFELGRAVILLRAAVALGFYTDAESWSRVTGLLLHLQTQGNGWEEFAEQYVTGRRVWLGLPESGKRDDADMRALLENVSLLRKSVWRTTPFRFRLD
jgi:Protein of unknown function (DUF1266)